MRRISIVFQETDTKATGDTKGTGQGFVVFMDGHDPERMKLPDEKLSAAEFWGRKCFSVVVSLLNASGAMVSAHKPKDV